MKKIILVFLSVVLALGMFAGCGRTQPLDPVQNFVEPDFDTTDKLKFDWKIPTQDTLSSGETAVMKYVKSKFNVTLNFDEQSPVDHSQKLDLLIASKQVPDIVSRIPYGTANEYGSYGMFLNLQPYLKYMPNVQKIIDRAITENPYNKSVLYDDEGRIFRLPNFMENPIPIFNYAINEQMFADAGYPNPTTWTDVKSALVAIKASKGGNFFPFAMRKQDNMGTQLTNFIISFTEGYAQGQQFIGYDKASDSFKLSTEIDGYRQAMDFVKELYAEGLINTKYNSMNGDELLKMMKDGQCAMTCDFMGGQTGTQGFEAETSAFRPLHLPAAPGKKQVDGYRILSFHEIAGTAVNVSVLGDKQKLGRVLSMLDYIYSDEFFKLQWYHPNVTEGNFPTGESDVTKYVYPKNSEGKEVYKYKPEVYQKANLADVKNNYFNWAIYAHFRDLADPIAEPNQHAKYYKFRQELIDSNNYVEIPLPVFTAAQFKQIASLSATVTNRFNTFIAQYIHAGTLSWESFENTLKSEGGTKLIRIYNEAYAATKNSQS